VLSPIVARIPPYVRWGLLISAESDHRRKQGGEIAVRLHQRWVRESHRRSLRRHGMGGFRLPNGTALSCGPTVSPELTTGYDRCLGEAQGSEPITFQTRTRQIKRRSSSAAPLLLPRSLAAATRLLRARPQYARPSAGASRCRRLESRNPFSSSPGRSPAPRPARNDLVLSPPELRAPRRQNHSSQHRDPREPSPCVRIAVNTWLIRKARSTDSVAQASQNRSLRPSRNRQYVGTQPEK
jgi:hypothetical protein